MNLARDAILFFGALGVGSLINWAIYAFSIESRALNPWAAEPAGFPRRTWLDRLPLVGWWRLRREAREYGHWFWIRPILIEVAYAAGMLWLFHFETTGKLLPPQIVLAGAPTIWYPIFATHAILIALLTVATFIDFDEQHIPDIITIPGAIILLLITTTWPRAHLPTFFSLPPPAGLSIEPLLFTTEPAAAWPAWLNGPYGLLIGLGVVLCWFIAMLHPVMTLRHGWPRAIRYYLASLLRRNPLWEYGLLFGGAGLGVAVAWWFNGSHWQSLLTALLGLAFAGGLVWGVRIGGYLGLRKEAMGFGDVTLMTMIGVALGWQASLLVFFLSPFTACIVALAQFVLTRRQDIAFGPYLALAAVVVIVTWRTLWENIARLYFETGDLVLFAVLFFLLAMTGLLWIWRLIKEAIFKLE